jgi:hypothetical protein
MYRNRVGKSLLTFALVGGALVAFLADWSASHVYNPLWHHLARYHIAANLFFLAGVASIATRLLWRPSREPQVAFAAAALFSLAFWTPFFYVPVLVPAASYWAEPGQEPRIAGMIIYPNLVVFAIFTLVTAAGWWFGRSTSPNRELPHAADTFAPSSQVEKSATD